MRSAAPCQLPAKPSQRITQQQPSPQPRLLYFTLLPLGAVALRISSHITLFHILILFILLRELIVDLQGLRHLFHFKRLKSASQHLRSGAIIHKVGHLMLVHVNDLVATALHEPLPGCVAACLPQPIAHVVSSPAHHPDGHHPPGYSVDNNVRPQELVRGEVHELVGDAHGAQLLGEGVDCPVVAHGAAGELSDPLHGPSRPQLLARLPDRLPKLGDEVGLEHLSALLQGQTALAEPLLDHVQ
mmetsp:Transcript_32622/g.92496  ORF Transcript_32622/g.92496 Transcript_32622/m.92496 type:complete len:243 (+) Transcript_32622:85-813(+)